MLPNRSEEPGLYAGVTRRFGALAIDGFLFIFLYFLLAIWVDRIPGQFGIVFTKFIYPAVFMVLVWLYFAFLESSRFQATLGKAAAELRVTDMEGARIGFGRATARFFAKFVSAAPCLTGFLIADITPRQQALHDLMTGTCVVRIKALRGWQQRVASGAPVTPGAKPWGLANTIRASFSLGIKLLIIGAFFYFIHGWIAETDRLRTFCESIPAGENRSALEASVAARGYTIEYKQDTQGAYAVVYQRQAIYRDVCIVDLSSGQTGSAHFRPFQ